VPIWLLLFGLTVGRKQTGQREAAKNVIGIMQIIPACFFFIIYNKHEKQVACICLKYF
jgi:hypothetical protein